MKQFSFSMDTLGKYIAHLREQKGWSQRELSRRSGVSFAQIQRIESGETDSPGIKLLEQLAGTLNVPLEALTNAYQGREPAIITTNHDKLLEQAFSSMAKALPPEIITSVWIEEVNRRYPDKKKRKDFIFKIFGDLSDV